MKLYHLTYSFIIGFILISCGEDKKPVLPEPAPVQESKPKTLIVGSFTEIPSEIDGCSCNFSADSTAFNNRSYLFVDNMQKTAFMKINGELVKLEETTHQQKDSVNFFSSYKSGSLKVDVEATTGKKTGDESTSQFGTITIQQEDGQKLTKTFYGDCGC